MNALILIMKARASCDDMYMANEMAALVALAAAAAQPLGHDVDVSTGLRRSSFSHGNFFDEASSILAKFGKI